MALVLFDSNIVIDYLNGIAEAHDELTYWDEPAIRVISWKEVRANIMPVEENKFELLFSEGGFEIIRIDDAIMTAAARIRTEGLRKGPKIAPDGRHHQSHCASSKTPRHYPQYQGLQGAQPPGAI
ncbi:type II toxin-antitoxin system VapC family toxin [Duganella phyllosphaerae]|uniref:type II toxin-antitoxin system VapC family toxin n=1 Tax=Duganella phyllosphaerae TaxID=762836 RepID=UPI00114D29D3|nr:type II toxin-antitoxin system VapC family toxin [Duganella phyllosphaerae]